ncbi:phosphoglycerate mutase family protein [Paraburkholderia sp. CNPSo 3272]|uniref:phosphoglycerate mutase family protein n=1 Tax=Paraburkholderia sp. CNPSo 3272 TaxID=2940931 RepID=UPI0020B63AF3|nr:phosphoglycerate mutase family protein [Paraburkholderia sp. CNPSo 3272]MCP3725111.1 phosphoglycerate mutase family protein [Paraburkholderia sp. CNPSo 3272]
MGPHRILFIRHAEKPGVALGGGVGSDGGADEESLAVRGWQRAGALARMFAACHNDRDRQLWPNAVFAAGLGQGSMSKRSMQTVEPLVAVLRESTHVNYVTRYAKDEGQELMADVLVQSGVVLIAWEHKVLPSLIRHLPGAAPVPQVWPDDRFDMVWVFERTAHGWSFVQKPQLLLAGDSQLPIV